MSSFIEVKESLLSLKLWDSTTEIHFCMASVVQILDSGFDILAAFHVMKIPLILCEDNHAPLSTH